MPPPERACGPEIPIEIRRGNDDPAVIWEFESAPGVAADLTGSTFALIVAWPAIPDLSPDGPSPAGTIEHSSDPAVDLSASALVVDAAAGRVTWPHTLAESEAVPRGMATGGIGPRYVLRRTIAGRTRDWAGGPVIVRSYL